MKPTPKLLAFLLGSCLLAADAVSQTVTLTVNDGTGLSSYNTGLNWSDGLAPSAGKDYEITRQLRGPVTTAADQDFTFAGDSLTINSGGTLAWQGSSNFPSGALTVNNLILNGGQISVFRGNSTLTMNGNISVTAASNLSLGSTADTGTQVRNIILNSTISGSSLLRMNAQNNNPSFLTINGNNSGFSGGFLLTGNNAANVSSTLNVGHANALGTGTVTVNQGILNLSGFSVTIGGLSGANDTGNSIQNNSNTAATLTVDSSSNTTYAGVIQNGSGTGNLGLTKSGNGTLILTNTNTYTGATTVSAGTLEIQGSIANTASITNNAALIFNSAVAQSYGNAIGGTGTLAKQGVGTLTLSGTNTYTGDTTVSQGILQIGDGTATAGTLGNNNTSNASIASGAVLRIARTGTGGSALQYTGTLLGSGTLEILSGARLDLSKDQASSYNLAFVVDGTLAIRTGGSQQVQDVQIGELSGSGSIIRGGNAPAAPAPVSLLTIGGKNTNSTYSGSIAALPELGIEKVGTGTLTLTGANSYTGTTLVSAGTLLVNGSLGNSAVTVDPLAVIGGTGSIGGSLTFAGNSFLEVVDLGDALAVGGTISFGSGFGIANLLGINWDDLDLNTPYTVLSTSQTFGESDIANFGSDNRLAVGLLGREAYFTNGSLAVIVIPEPRAALLGGLGLLMLLRRRRG